jgi:hypothetical protein
MASKPIEREPVLRTVPNFVPTLDHRPWQLGTPGWGRESPVMSLKINLIADHRTPS